MRRGPMRLSETGKPHHPAQFVTSDAVSRAGLASAVSLLDMPIGYARTVQTDRAPLRWPANERFLLRCRFSMP